MQTELNEETLAFIQWQNENPDVWGDQDENGVDLARLRENLRLTPAERLAEHERARRSAKTMEEAGERHKAKGLKSLATDASGASVGRKSADASPVFCPRGHGEAKRQRGISIPRTDSAG